MHGLVYFQVLHLGPAVNNNQSIQGNDNNLGEVTK